ncbi:YncE family protein [Streptomyces sp. MS1.AVA.3]|uniref:YncE family protein n=1 Tax=Streptomyces decoyicus TaxID=249567 RepID=UPI0030C113B1
MSSTTPHRLRPVTAVALAMVALLPAACADDRPPKGPAQTRGRVISIPVPKSPSAVVVAPDGRRVYVISTPADKISVIDAESSRVIGSARVGSQLSDLVLSSPGETMYVANAGSNSVAVIDPISGEVTKTIATKNPYAMATHPMRDQVYVLNDVTPTTVTPIAVDPDYPWTPPKAETPFPVEKRAEDIAVAPGGDSIYLLGRESVVELEAGTRRTRATYPVGAGSGSIVVHPWKPLAYVVNSSSRSVWVLDTKERRTIGAIPVGFHAYAAAVSPDGRRLYVGVLDSEDSTDHVLTIDTTTNTITGKSIPVGDDPVALAVSPRGNRLYVLNNVSSDVSVVTLPYR